MLSDAVLLNCYSYVLGCLSCVLWQDLSLCVGYETGVVCTRSQTEKLSCFYTVIKSHFFCLIYPNILIERTIDDNALFRSARRNYSYVIESTKFWLEEIS